MTAGTTATDLGTNAHQQATGNQQGFIHDRLDMVDANAQTQPLIDKTAQHQADDEHHPPADVARFFRINNAPGNTGNTGDPALGHQ